MAPTSTSASVATTAIAPRYAQFAAIATAVWLLLMIICFVVWPPVLSTPDGFDGLRLVMALVAVGAPIGLFWLAAAMASTIFALRAEVYRLQNALDTLRGAVKLGERPSEPPKPVSSPAPSVSAPQPAVRTQATPVLAPVQQTFALGGATGGGPSQLGRVELIIALNFPDDEHDTAGFAALRKAMRDSSVQRLIQASQDVLTLLSQDGIYMDDLVPNAVDPELWRRFGAGERGGSIAALGAIDREEAVAFVARRVREDTIFRDAVHHFLRNFDRLVARLAPEASDGELDALTQTRSARAFMVLGRAAGTFD